MRVWQKVQQTLGLAKSGIHQRRIEALGRAVDALVSGGKLWLTELGRAIADVGREKHGIKAIDRLLGNVALYSARFVIYKMMAKWVCKGRQHPILLVDISEIRPGTCELTASLAMTGRAIPIYGIVRKKKTISKARTLRLFLQDLAKILPVGMKPVVVTDAGFQSPWFDAVLKMGWHYLGRVRHQTRFLSNDEWISAQDLHRMATNLPRNLGLLPFPKRSPSARRLVLSKARVSKKRRRNNKLGRKGKTANDRRCRKSEREPWLLATSLSCAPRHVVDIYAMRMQIEQNYRDTKNHRWGWQLSLSGSKSNARLEMLLLIAALAMLAMLATGAIAETLDHHLRYQANTTRNKRVLSWFFLGLRILKRRDVFLTQDRFASGLNLIQQQLRCLEMIV